MSRTPVVLAAAGLAALSCFAGAAPPVTRMRPTAEATATRAVTSALAPGAVAAASYGVVSRAAAHTTPAQHPMKLLVVMLENHSETHALEGMPLLAGVARRFAYARDYSAVAHPSLPNYLAVIGGSTFGVADDAGPAAHPVHGASVLDQAIARGLTARTYAESMPGHCVPVPAGRYAVKHNPWAYFVDRASRANCQMYDVASGSPGGGALHHDVVAGTLPNIGLLIPNLCDDAHDCPLSTADRWLAPWLTQIMAGPDWRAGKLAVAVTFDEDDYSQANKVLAVLAYPTLHSGVVTAALGHYSLAALASSIVGAPPLRNAARAPSLRAAFHL